jgi:acetoin:2,6-dichlorophenolindophenol oxidoreductase subunit alpha
MSDALDLYRQVRLIRSFESSLLELFRTGVLHGTVHTCLGQEATPAALAPFIGKGDNVLGSHRSHGYFLALGHDPYRLYAEIMGRATGVCGGRGGSQHLYAGNFMTSGVQGSFVPVAVGMALAAKQAGDGTCAIALLGDGTLGEGVVYESLNFAALHALPVLFLVENNRIAQTTPVEWAVAGKIVDRARAFGIEAGEIESTDAVELAAYLEPVVARVRAGAPAFHVVHCQRFGPHSRRDDPRDAELLRSFEAIDPLVMLRKRLAADDCDRVDREVEAELAAARERALADPVDQAEVA